MDLEPAIASEKSEAQRLEDYKAVAQTVAQAEDVTEQDMVNPVKVDRDFVRFMDRISPEKTQVLRYQRGGSPLWIGPYKPAAADIPPCAVCGQPRIFEFQINPQLLSHLEVEAAIDRATIDWGVLAVYTCAARLDFSG